MYESPRLGWLLGVGPVDRSIALLRWGGFWAAIFLPFVHVPLLLTDGLAAASLPVLLALWFANVGALVLGRQHSPHGRPAESGGGRR